MAGAAILNPHLQIRACLQIAGMNFKTRQEEAAVIRLITRSDDAGSSQGANQAMIRAAAHPFVKNISLMATGAYIEDAAQALKGKKHICFGLHFTMNAEWDRVKWGPVSSAAKVASLVDRDGWFYPDPAASRDAGALIEDIHTEWCSQLDRLTKLGFDVRYADTHMFPELVFDGLADIMSGWYKEKGLVDHRYFYRILPRIDDISKTDGLFEEIIREQPDGQYFYLTHPAVSTEDMYLTGNKTAPTQDIVNGRRMDMDFIISDKTMEICEKYDVLPIRYDEAVVSEADRDSGSAWLGV